MSYDIDFMELLGRILPSALRGESISAFFSVLARPFRELHTKFILYRDERGAEIYGKLWYLEHNCTVDSMQAMLNDFFHERLSHEGFNPYPEDPADAPIKVEDGVEGNEVLVYPASLGRPTLTLVRLSLGSTWGARPFTVKIPEEMRDIIDEYRIDEDRVHRLVDIFKLYGIRYNIVYY